MIVSGPGVFLFGRWQMMSSMSSMETSWEMSYLAWYSSSWTSSISERSAETGGGRIYSVESLPSAGSLLLCGRVLSS